MVYQNGFLQSTNKEEGNKEIGLLLLRLYYISIDDG